jgi:hypothetical protein
MVRVLTRFRGQELALGASILAAAMVIACGGKALNVGSEEPNPTSEGAKGGTGGSGVAGSSVASSSVAGSSVAGSSVAGSNVGATSATSPDRGSVGGAGGTGSNELPPLTAEELATIQWPADTPCTESPESPKVGTWKGHWPDGMGIVNTDVVVHITGLTAAGVPCGTVTIGEGPAPPPVTDADAIYPPSAGMGGGAGLGTGGTVVTQPWPGYEYRMLNVQATDSRLAFTIIYQEILRPWCQLQPAVKGSRSCLPEWQEGRSDGPQGQLCTISGPKLPPTVVPCFKIPYCSSSTCFCYDGACDVSLQGQQTAFELHWDGAALEGSVNQTQLIFLDPMP